MAFNFGGKSGSGDKKPTFSFGGAATPAASGNPNIFGQASTTPAGPPPSSTGFSFGSSQPASNTTTTSFTGAAAPNASAATPAATAPTSTFSFGGASTTPASTPAPGGYSFAGMAAAAKPADKPADKPTFSFGSTAAIPSTEKKAGDDKPAFSFGGAPPAAAPTAANTTTSAVDFKPQTAGFSFGAPTSATQSDKAAEKPATNAFGGLNASKEDKVADKPAAGFSFGASIDASKSDQTAEKPATTPFSFGNTKTAAAAAASEAKPAEATKPAFGFGNATQTNTDKASAAPAPAVLKNKTLDELVTKWSQDLEKYAGAFQKQARQIANWDQTLLASGDAISRLYAATATAEQTSGKVDQALAYIEHQQDELEALLTTYESQVKDISNEVGVSQPVDLEREKAYGQAEKLITELDSMGKDLAGMMTEINRSADTMSQLKESDPLSSIVKTLNQHVESLTWIDENATLLSEKLDSLQTLQAEKARTPAQRFAFGSMRLD